VGVGVCVRGGGGGVTTFAAMMDGAAGCRLVSIFLAFIVVVHIYIYLYTIIYHYSW
jgi:uncharacterized membrane protein